MGFYINSTSKGTLGSSAQSKINGIIEDGGMIIDTPKQWSPNLVCVADNGWFGSAGYAFSKNEMDAFLVKDRRPKTWLKYEKAMELSGFVGNKRITLDFVGNKIISQDN
jgi:hypothetical protein